MHDVTLRKSPLNHFPYFNNTQITVIRYFHKLAQEMDDEGECGRVYSEEGVRSGK